MSDPTRKLPTTTLGVQRMISMIYSGVIDYYYEEEMIIQLRRIGQVTRGLIMEKVYLPAFLDFFRWYVCLCNKLGFKLDDVLWNKYPGVCPYCLERICKGFSRGIQLESLSRHRSQTGKPRSIRGWQRLIARIYGQVNSTRSPEYLFERLREEVNEAAELAQAPISEQNLEPLSLEMADIGAWFLGTATRLGIDLESGFLSRYNWKCPSCNEIPCFRSTRECG